MPPVKIGKPPKRQVKIGFVAKTNIQAGEELFFDYGIKDPDLPSLSTYAKKMLTTLQTLTVPPPQEKSSTPKSRPRLSLLTNCLWSVSIWKVLPKMYIENHLAAQVSESGSFLFGHKCLSISCIVREVYCTGSHSLLTSWSNTAPKL